MHTKKQHLTGSKIADIIVILAIIIVPLMYGGLLSSAYQNPTNRLGDIKAAVVNLDKATTATLATGKTKKFALGDKLTDRLTNPKDGEDVGFSWQQMSKQQAASALSNEGVRAVLTIPANFSKRAAQLGTEDATAASAQTLKLVTDDGINYLSGTLAKSVALALQNELSEQGSETYLSQVLLAFDTVKEGMQDAADGSGKLADGGTQLATGAGQLAAGVDSAATGAGKLVSALQLINNGSASANSGAAQLANGANALNSGVQEYTAGVARAAAGAQGLQAGAAKLPELAKGVEKYTAGVDAINAEVQKQLEQLAQLEKLGVTLPPQAQQAIASLQENLQKLSAKSEKLREGAASTLALQEGSKQLANGLSALTANNGALNAGAAQLAGGAQQLAQGTGQLAAGTSQAAAGASQLQGGAGELQDGAHKLATGSQELATGLTTLHSGISTGADKIPAYSGHDITHIAKTAANPVQVEAVRSNPVVNNGAGFAPMFLSLSLWIGGIAIFLVVPALTRRSQEQRWWLAPLKPAAGALPLGIAQALALMIGANAIAGLGAANLPGLIALGVLASLTFVAVNHALISLLAFRGRFVSIVLLCLQITSMGATFPVETTPQFFQWVHPLLPMSYTQLAFRDMIAGAGATGAVQDCVLVLLGWLLAAVAVIFLGSWLRRRKPQPLPFDNALLGDTLLAE